MCYIVEYRDERSGLQSAHFSTSDDALRLCHWLQAVEGLMPYVREVEDRSPEGLP